jgi:uncharacterized peroxidase-related enzyme
MPHIALPEGLPGILGPLAFRPDTAKPLLKLADLLLHADHSLTRAERELIAAFVSLKNGCEFCATSHRATVSHHPGGSTALVDAVARDFETAPVSPKMKALLAIAAAVAESGTRVTSAMIDRAREAGATDVEIHDAVLIAAAFCMFNRYVDGLGAHTPSDPAAYDVLGRFTASQGYAKPGLRPVAAVWSWIARRR